MGYILKKTKMLCGEKVPAEGDVERWCNSPGYRGTIIEWEWLLQQYLELKHRMDGLEK